MSDPSPTKQEQPTVDQLRDDLLHPLRRHDQYMSWQTDLFLQLDARCKAGDLPSEWKAGEAAGEFMKGMGPTAVEFDRIAALEAVVDAPYPGRSLPMTDPSSAKQELTADELLATALSGGKVLDRLEAYDALHLRCKAGDLPTEYRTAFVMAQKDQIRALSAERDSIDCRFQGQQETIGKQQDRIVKLERMADSAEAECIKQAKQIATLTREGDEIYQAYNDALVAGQKAEEERDELKAIVGLEPSDWKQVNQEIAALEAERDELLACNVEVNREHDSWKKSALRFRKERDDLREAFATCPTFSGEDGDDNGPFRRWWHAYSQLAVDAKEVKDE